MIIDFSKKNVDKLDDFYFDIHFGNCWQYKLFHNESEIGFFYFDHENSFGKIDDTAFLIKQVKAGFKFTDYAIINLRTNSIIGQIALYNLSSGKSKDSIIEIDGYQPFNWEVLTKKLGYHFFKTYPVSEFAGRLFNDLFYISFNWYYENEDKVRYEYDLKAKGEIHIRDNDNKILVLIGLFLCEKELNRHRPQT